MAETGERVGRFGVREGVRAAPGERETRLGAKVASISTERAGDPSVATSVVISASVGTVKGAGLTKAATACFAGVYATGNAPSLFRGYLRSHRPAKRHLHSDSAVSRADRGFLHDGVVDVTSGFQCVCRAGEATHLTGRGGECPCATPGPCRVPWTSGPTCDAYGTTPCFGKLNNKLACAIGHELGLPSPTNRACTDQAPLQSSRFVLHLQNYSTPFPSAAAAAAARRQRRQLVASIPPGLVPV